jgi:choline-glycine betaine transporter
MPFVPARRGLGHLRSPAAPMVQRRERGRFGQIRLGRDDEALHRLLVAGGLQALQQAAIIAAAPFTLVMIRLCVSLR